MSRICYYPRVGEQNSYCKKFAALLSRGESIFDFDVGKGFTGRLIELKRHKVNIIVVNWIENHLIKKSKISFYNFLKCFLKLLFLRATFGKMIYVRHNYYPHDLVGGIVWPAHVFISLVEYLSDEVIVHSPVLGGGRKYVPHPLYDISEGKNSSSFNHSLEDYFICFGRVKEYKGIKDLVKAFPLSQSLLIVGDGDQDYCGELMSVVSHKKNIVFINNQLKDYELASLIQKSRATIVPSTSQSALLSGSIMFSISCNKRVLALESATNNWLASTYGESVVKVFSSLEEMAMALNSFLDCGSFISESVLLEFGDGEIKKRLVSIL